jgi:hypothetical protein
VVLLGTLGFSSVANAGMIVNWMSAYEKQDCLTTCNATSLKAPIVGGIDYKTRKPLSICATKKEKRGGWLIGYNRWKENTCIIGADGKEFQGKNYRCLCSDHGIQPLGM